ncbi:MAG: hypothetical protein JWO94_1793 [Verrucomicrobiaceae bacterium]|nr:hypothetical protein [Verrucomicrobiaceae bacterium]
MPSMKTFPSLVLLLGLCLTLLAPRPVQADEEVSFDYFYDTLAPYGTWVEIEGYGPCWSPAEVDADWAPYTDGQWVYTDAGWTWAGDEPFASIVYHYGRWILAGNQGWCWVPGYEWGPAWVSWRDNDEYVGWAPLPPEAVWEPDQGLGIWVDEVYGIGPSFYRFCHHRDFGDRHLRSVLMARTWNSAIIVQTNNVTNISYNRSFGVAYCGGPAYDRASRFSSRPITALRLERRSDFDFSGDHRHALLPNGLIQGGNLVVTAPRVRPAGDSRWHFPTPPKVIGQSQVQRGWAGKGATGDLDSVRRKMQEEVQGRTPKTAPARPVAQADLQFLPHSGHSLPQSIPAQQTVRPGLPATTDEIKRRMAVQPIPAQEPARTPQRTPFNGQPQQSIPVPPVTNDQRQVTRSNNGGADPIGTYLQRQREEAETRNQVEKQRLQESFVRQQNMAAETRQQAASQQQGREAIERQRLERGQLQAQSAIQEGQRQRQQQQQQQFQVQQQQQQQAATMARERERQNEVQRRSAMTPPPAAAVQTPSPVHSSSRKVEDSDDRQKKR